MRCAIHATDARRAQFICGESTNDARVMSSGATATDDEARSRVTGLGGTSSLPPPHFHFYLINVHPCMASSGPAGNFDHIGSRNWQSPTDLYHCMLAFHDNMFSLSKSKILSGNGLAVLFQHM